MQRKMRVNWSGAGGGSFNLDYSCEWDDSAECGETIDAVVYAIRGLLLDLRPSTDSLDSEAVDKPPELITETANTSIRLHGRG